MRSLALAGVALAALTSGAAQADDLYLKLMTGYNGVPQQEIRGNGSSADLNYNAGYGVGGALGYQLDFDGFYLFGEGEMALRHNNFDDGEEGGMTSEFPGWHEQWSFMGNLGAGFALAESWNVYAGGGVGYSRGTFAVDTVGVKVSDRDWSFAWQGFAGVGYEVAPGFTVGVEYRYFHVGDQDFTIGATDLSADYDSHSGLVTGKIEMGPLLRAFGAD